MIWSLSRMPRLKGARRGLSKAVHMGVPWLWPEAGFEEDHHVIKVLAYVKRGDESPYLWRVRASQVGIAVLSPQKDLSSN